MILLDYFLYLVDSNLVISNNCFVSASHCSVIRDEQGDIWLNDTRYYIVCARAIIVMIAFDSCNF